MSPNQPLIECLCITDICIHIDTYVYEHVVAVAIYHICFQALFYEYSFELLLLLMSPEHAYKKSKQNKNIYINKITPKKY